MQGSVGSVRPGCSLHDPLPQRADVVLGEAEIPLGHEFGVCSAAGNCREEQALFRLARGQIRKAGF